MKLVRICKLLRFIFLLSRYQNDLESLKLHSNYFNLYGKSKVGKL